MMTPDEKGTLPLRTEKLFYDLQDRIYADIVRRIKKTGEITSTADYQINKLLLLGNSTEFIEKELKNLSAVSLYLLKKKERINVAVAVSLYLPMI